MKRFIMSALMLLAAGAANANDLHPMSMACGGVSVNHYYDWQGKWIKYPSKTVEKFNLVFDPANNTMTVQNASGSATYSGVIVIPSHLILDGNWPDQDRANNFITLFVDRNSGEYRLTAWTDRARKETVQSFSVQSQGTCQPNRYWK